MGWNSETDRMLKPETFREAAPEGFRRRVMERIDMEQPQQASFRIPVLRMAAAVAVFLFAALIVVPRLQQPPLNPGVPSDGNPPKYLVNDPLPTYPEGSEEALGRLRAKVDAKLNWLVNEGGGREKLIQEKERLVSFSGKMTAGISFAVTEVGSTTMKFADKLNKPPDLTFGWGSPPEDEAPAPPRHKPDLNCEPPATLL